MVTALVLVMVLLQILDRLSQRQTSVDEILI